MSKRHARWILVALAASLLIGVRGQPQAGRAASDPHLGYGINVRIPDHVSSLFAPLGFNWVKLWEEYTPVLPAQRLPYRVHYLIGCQGYIADTGDNLQGWGNHVETMARTNLGRVDSYEVCNEPNLAWMWEGRSPDPARYARMLCAAYQRIKAVDPAATVVSGGLAPVGRIQGGCGGWSGNNCMAMDERTYLAGVLAQGAGDCMDVFGYHPFGFAYPPEQDPYTVGNGFAFRGTEVMRQILVNHGLADLPVWATEFGWVRDPSEDGQYQCHSGDNPFEQAFGWMDVSGQLQADYTVRAFRYADENWPWMHVMFLWNLDWHNYPNGGVCEASRYFSVRKENQSDLGAPAPVYGALVGMEKRPGPYGPRLQVSPTALLLLADVDEPEVKTTTITIQNTSYRTLTWTASGNPAGGIVPTLSATSGAQGERLFVLVNTTGLGVGVYTGTVTITATASEGVADSPQQVVAQVRVLEKLERIYVPFVTRSP